MGVPWALESKDNPTDKRLSRSPQTVVKVPVTKCKGDFREEQFEKCTTTAFAVERDNTYNPVSGSLK
jgi:hypothetical protein